MRSSNPLSSMQPWDQPFAELPHDLLRRFENLESQLKDLEAKRKIAVFDLDNTLLVGDIGDAVFAKLRIQGHVRQLSWSHYRELLNDDKREAFIRVVTAMKGLPERTVAKATLSVLSGKSSFIELERALIPTPRPHPVMRTFVQLLRHSGYQIYVISASNEISARLAATTCFGIPASHVFGIRARIVNGLLTEDLLEPLPIGQGKTQVYRAFIGEVLPLITAGDSHLDVPLLQMTDSRGFSIWVGEERIGFQVVQSRIATSHKFHFVQRPAQLQFDEESLYD